MSTATRNQSNRRLWCATGLVAALVVASLATMAFEAITGGLTGTVIQARIDQCSESGVRIAAIRSNGSTVTFQVDCVPLSSVTPHAAGKTGPVVSYVRSELWESTQASSHAMALDKPESVIMHVKQGDVLQFCLNEPTLLMSWESNHSTDRWAIIATAIP